MAIHEGYSSGHCWYYRLGGRILSPEEICKEAECSGKERGYGTLIEQLDRAKEPKRSALIADAIRQWENDQRDNIQKYRDAAERVEYERRWNGPYDWDKRRMWEDPCTAVSLKHNHIFYVHSTLIRLRSMTQQMSLF